MEILPALNHLQDTIQELNREVARVTKTVTTLQSELENKQLTFELVQDKDSKARF